MPNIDLSILNQRQTPAFFADTLANRPAAGFLGRIFISTDTLDLYRDTGTTWVLLSSGGGGGITGSGATGQVTYFNGTSSVTGSNDLFWDSVNGHLGIGTNTPGTALSIHHYQNQIIQLNQTTATNDTKIAFQNSGVALWRIGNSYNAGANDYSVFDVVSNLERFSIKTTGQTFIGLQTTSSGRLVVNDTTGDNHIVVIGATSPSIRVRNAGVSPTQQFGLGLATTTNNFIQGTTGGEFCIFNSSTTASPILFGIWDAGLSNVQEAAEISSSRNLIIGGGADGGQKLQVVGTALLSGSVTQSGITQNYSVTSSSAIARSTNITSTLIATANADVLVGIDINPTFNQGAFANVANAGIRISGQLLIGTGKTASSNICIGNLQNGRSLTSGIQNIGIGAGSIPTISSGSSNVCVGSLSGGNISTTSNNSAFGHASMQSSSGSDNSGFGFQTLNSGLNGSNNTAIGSRALISTGAASNNIAVGFQAGRYAGSGVGTNNTTSSNSLYIGYDVRPSANGNSNEVVIAAYNGTAGVIGLGTNTTSIGNSSTTFTAIYGNLLLGTQTNGASKLRVVGLPTSSAGLSSGDVWNNAGVLNIVP